jgi:hypothetical protein
MMRGPPPSVPPESELTKVRRRILWRKITTYKASYVAKKSGDVIVVRSLNPLPKTRVFKVAGGMRKYKRTKYSSNTNEVIVVAKTAKKNKKGKKNRGKKDEEEILDEELDDLENIDELDDLESDDDDEPDDEDEEDSDDGDDDEDEDEDEEEEEDEEEDEDDEDEEEEEAPKKKGKKTSKTSSKKSSRSKKTDGKVGTQELADHLKVDARSLRMLLRKMQVPKDPETSRYEWDSLNHPQVKKIVKAHKSGATKRAKQEGLDKLKERKGKTAASKTKKTSSSKGKKKKSS